ncbi:MAG: hypothetical protein WC982_13290, partial [Advenella sp.]
LTALLCQQQRNEIMKHVVLFVKNFFKEFLKPFFLNHLANYLNYLTRPLTSRCPHLKSNPSNPRFVSLFTAWRFGVNPSAVAAKE